MNKQGKTNTVLILVIVAVVIGAYFLIGSMTHVKTVAEHAVPADISSNEKGTGLQLKFYDANGNPIEIPSWFSAQTASVEPFAIVSHPPAPSCVDKTGCPGYATNPSIMCWNSKCVLGGVSAFTMGVQVTNPSASQVSFVNLAPSTASPASFNTALNKVVVAKLTPGQTASWSSTSISVTPFLGTDQIFSVSVQGTNEYTGVVNTVSDQLTLSFGNDPSGSFLVSVVAPI